MLHHLGMRKIWLQNYISKAQKETHIDHIIPLQNRLVCGLHCISNLQAIPAEDNLSKFNKFDPDRIETLIIKELCNT